MSEIFSIDSLAENLKGCSAIEERLKILDRAPLVGHVLNKAKPLKNFLQNCSKEEALVIKSIIVIGQADRIFNLSSGLVSSESTEIIDEFSRPVPQSIAEGAIFKGRGEKNRDETVDSEGIKPRTRGFKSCQKTGEFKKGIKELLQFLIPVERFYSSIGGLVGYHSRMLDLLSKRELSTSATSTYYPAEGIDISSENEEVRQAILSGIERLPDLAEIYPVGGAADRLRLHDEKSGVALPAAKLPFLGKTLLEGMIADLQSREYLYYKLFGTQITTPIAMMTSQEKDNHRHILTICEEGSWFGRPKDSFRFFCQPSVPTVNRSGEWCLQGPMQLFLKPGGHGVIWRLARDIGIFDWFFSCGRIKALVRQINNPVANTDYGLLAFTGIGCAQDKVFGFASCPRQVKMSEGINVVIETPKDGGYEYVLTNIEYCDFKKFGIVDQPLEAGSLYSKFSSNTNILFLDIKAVLEAVQACPIPGILVNLKKVTYRTESGEKKEEEIARLESTMQNIADFFTEPYSKRLGKGERHQLKTFLTYNERRKTISAAKREFALGASLVETPEGCFLDILKNGRDLLTNQCTMQVPDLSDPANFFSHGPSFIFLYHPALGPLYSIIGQKIRGGVLYPGSELQLEIAELQICNLELEGSLRVLADSPMGHFDGGGILNYSPEGGKCILKGVRVRNQGIDFDAPNIYWKNEIARHESCLILLHGNGEFYAENVTLAGDLQIEVKRGERVTAWEEGGVLQIRREPLEKSSWHWTYEADKEHRITLKVAH